MPDAPSVPIDLPDLDLVDGIEFTRNKGSQPWPVLVVERPLGPADVPTLLNPPPGLSPKSENVVKYLQHHHHTIARAYARGATNLEVSLISGFDLAYLSTLKNDPALQELISAYKAQEDAAYVDAMQRLTALGLSGVEELAKRLQEEPEKFTKNELMALVDMGLIKPAKAGGGGGATATLPGAAPFAIQVNFVGAEPKGVSIEGRAVPQQALPAVGGW